MSFVLTPGSEDVVYIFDLSAQIHRFWYKVQGWAARNFIDAVKRMFVERRPTYCVFVADNPWPTFRHTILDEFIKARGLDGALAYKANRKKPAREKAAILEQCRIATELAEDCFGMRALTAKGFEADDVIATITKLARGWGLKVVIAGKDKDLAQLLVDPDVYLWDMKNTLTSAKDIEAKFLVRIEQLGDYLALVGDTSDNVPGVERIGKTAAREILDVNNGGCASLDIALRAATEGPTGEHRTKLMKGRYVELPRAQVEEARLSRRLVTLHNGVPSILTDITSPDDLRCGEWP